MQDKIETLLTEMTLEEKASLCSGLDFWATKPVNRLGIPSVCVADGPHGLRKEDEIDDNVGIKQSFPATSFPPAVNIASTWDVSLAGAVGEELAKQCVDQGVSVILGPGTNIKRSPLCGRNFEYFSEDPYLAGKMCASYIDNVQKYGVGTSLKHYACNNQEYLRMSINAIVDERALREVYLPAFETAVKESQPCTVMCSYNKLNGTYLSDNKKMLDDILRKEWGFEGLVISDWNATNDRVEGIKAGMDLEMPSSMGRTDKQIVKAVKEGSLDEKELDRVVRRLLEFIFVCHENLQPNYSHDYDASHDVARKVAEGSFVLLKNDGDFLPLDDKEDIAVIGALAKESRYQGSGSSRINPYKLVDFVDNLTEEGIRYSYAPGYSAANDDIDEALIRQAVNVAKNKEKVLLFLGLTESYESEGYDRKHLDLPRNQLKLAEEVLKVNPNVAVILSGGSPVTMPWLDRVPALLNTYLAGEAGGEAIANVVFGRVNPSGKLAETYPLSLDDFIGSQYYGMGPKNVEHRESVYVGYRYYESAGKDVLFPFGYGMSYTSFEYSDLALSAHRINDNETVDVKFKVTNVGGRDGAEVAQLYISDVESTIFRPIKELRAFAKVFLKAGETKEITFTLDKRAFAYYNTSAGDWHVESGEFEIQVGASVRDIKLRDTVYLESTNPDTVVPDLRETCPTYYNIAEAKEIPVTEFEALYGDKMPPNIKSKRGEFDFNTTIGELKVCLIGKIIMKLAPSIIRGQVPNADMTTMLMIQQGFEEIPLRSLNGVTTGLLDMQAIYGFLLWGNKKRIRGLGNIIVGMIKSVKHIRFKNKEQQIKKAQLKRLKDEAKKLKEEHKEEIKSRKVELRVAKEEHKEELLNIKEEMKNIKK